MDKQREYYKILREVLDYLDGCAERRIVPLKHDVNVFRCRFNRAVNTNGRYGK